jgi:hypothetical protein
MSGRRQTLKEKIEMKKMMITMTALAAGLVMLFPGVASADLPVRTVTVNYEFHSIGHGDLGGFCLNNPTSPVPPEGAAFQSCAAVTPQAGEDHVGIVVADSEGNPVYFTAQQDNNPGFVGGCGHLEWGDTASFDSQLLFPINDSGPGGSAPDEVVAFPWAGPGINNVLDPGGAACQGSLDTNIITPGEVGTVRFEFHNEVA